MTYFSHSANAQFFNIGTPPFSTPNDLDCNDGNDQCTAIGGNDFQKPHLLAFDERQHVTLPAGGLTVDTDDSGGEAVLAAGTSVSSHMVIFDPKGPRDLSGYVDFAGTILGVLMTTTAQSGTDPLFGLPGVNYYSPNLRGLESNTDGFTISGSRLYVDFSAQTPGDHLRVLTASVVPVPAALPLLGAAIGAFGLFSRRRRA